MNVLQALQQKLESCELKEIPIVVACSAGPDSVALLLALKECYQTIRVVHINHRTRPECEEEEIFVKNLCEELKIPCFLYSLPNEIPEKNREEYWREKRREIFEEVCKKAGTSWIALGHHRGDNEETVCKRFFEGASFTYLQGMQVAAKQGNLFYFRPFLELSKEDLLSFLRKRQQSFCQDLSNTDLHYTRNRIRKFLDEDGQDLIGKNIRKGIFSQIEEAGKITRYLERRCASLPILEKSDSLGGLLRITDSLPDPYEMEYILRKFLKRHEQTFSKEQVEKAALALIMQEAGKGFFTKEADLFIDRGSAYLFTPKLSSYRFSLEESKEVNNVHLPLPEALLTGKMAFCIGKKVDRLDLIEGKFLIGKQEGQKERAKRKYPMQLRMLPLGVWSGSELVADLYSGLGVVEKGFAYHVRLEKQ